MPTYNRINCIKNAIDSLLAQTYQDFELIIVDDGSTDGTEDYVKELYKNEILENKIRYINLGEHKGVSFARNTGLENAKNEWIGYLDTDNTMNKDFLETFVESIRENPNSLIFYAQTKILPGGYVFGYPFDPERLLYENICDMGVIIHNRNLFKKLGGFDLELKRAVDWDLFIRYTKENTPVFINKALLLYDHSDSTKRISTKESLGDAYKRIVLKYYSSIPSSDFISVHNGLYLKNIDLKNKLLELEMNLEEKVNIVNSLRKEVERKQKEGFLKNEELSTIYFSRSWKFVVVVRKILVVLIPAGSRRRKIAGYVFRFSKKIFKFALKARRAYIKFLTLFNKGFTVLKKEGPAVFLKKTFNKFCPVFVSIRASLFARGIKKTKKTKKRILFINHEESATGAPRVLLDMLKKEQNINEFDCWVISLKTGDNPWNFNQLIKINDIPGLTYDKKAKYVTKKLDPDVVYANSVVSCDFASHFPCKKIAYIHEFRSLISFFDMHNKDMLKSFNEVVVVCEASQKLLKGWGIKSRTIPYYLNYNLDNLKIKKPVCVNDSGYLIGAGFVQLRKGIQRFFEIAELMPEKKFVWIGGMEQGVIKNGFITLSGENSLLLNYKEGDPITSVKIKLKIPTNVVFTGLLNFKDFSEKYILLADCFLMLSSDDPLPLVVTESKLFNLNVVTLKESGDSYKLCNGNDLILEEYNKDKIVEYLKNLKPNVKKINNEVKAWLESNFEKHRGVYEQQANSE